MLSEVLLELFELRRRLRSFRRKVTLISSAIVISRPTDLFDVKSSNGDAICPLVS